MPKEAHARIKINKLLETAGWRFFDDKQGKANIALEPNVRLTQAQVDAMGSDFETSSKGFIDFLLLDEHGFPLVVLEAKAEDKNPLIGKEQARKYAKSQNCRFVILSNGNLHYLWDLNQGNPHIITRFPAPDSIKGYTRMALTLAYPHDHASRHVGGPGRAAPSTRDRVWAVVFAFAARCVRADDQPGIERST